MTVKLTYFKVSGKYYSYGDYETEETDLTEIWHEVRDKQARGDWPGLVNGPHDFVTLVDVPAHPHNHPRLVFP